MAMKNINRQQSLPVKVPRTRRNHPLQVLTSAPAGKCWPLAYIPLLREDALNGRFRVTTEMLETAELLMNPVNMRITAYVVSHLAMERFEGSRDQFDRSYMGEAQIDGGSVIPFIETSAMGAHGANAVYKALGLHGKAADLVNTMPLEVYNLIWNFRAKNRSPDIAARTRLQADLAPAFWHHSQFGDVVPDFDQAVIDGEVALNVLNQSLPVKGIGKQNQVYGSAGATVYETGTAGTIVYPNSAGVDLSGANTTFFVKGSAAAAGVPEIYAELAENGITVSLSNLELAKKTQAFAKIREKYQEIDEEWIIDMLMDGLSIPDQALKQPILLADKTVRFAQAKRYATDAGNLAESAVSGGAMLDLSLRVPRLSTGGIVMIVAECLPEQLFERAEDWFFHSQDVADWPEYLRDTLDPEKVDIVTNRQVDTDHATPNATFGYEPMNAKTNRNGTKIGGKFYRPTTNTGTDDARQRLWAVENVNPTLSTDFYLATAIHQKPFLDIVSDPFEASVIGNAVIEGNTVFGGLLVEATSNYDDVAAKAPVERIDKEA